MNNLRPVLISIAALAAAALGFWMGHQNSTSPNRKHAAAARVHQENDPLLEKERSGLAAILDAPDEKTRIEQFLGALRSDDIPALTRLLAYINTPGVLPSRARPLYTQAIIDRVVALGGAEALLQMKGLLGPFRDALITGTIKSLAGQDLGAAEHLVTSLPPREYAIALEPLLAALGAQDPERGLSLLRERGTSSSQAVSGFFEAWVAKDPLSAVEAALAFSDSDLNTARSAISAWARLDPDAAWDWMQQKIPPDQQSEYHVSYLYALMRSESPEPVLKALLEKPELGAAWNVNSIGEKLGRDPETGAHLLDAFPPGSVRDSLIMGMAGSFSGEAEAALAWAQSLSPAERARALPELIEHFSSRDPAQALTLALAESEETAREKSIAAAMSGWGKRDFSGAVAATADLKPSDRLTALTSLFTAADYRSSANFPERLAALPPDLTPADRARILTGMGKSWSRDFEEAITVCRELPPADRGALAEGILSRGWNATPPEIVELAGMIPPERLSKAAWMVVERLAPTDPRAAAELVANIPDQKNNFQKMANLRTIVGNWTYVDPSGAEAFVRSLPPGPTREQALGSLVKSILVFDLPAATRIAAMTTGSKMRLDLIRRLSDEWKTTNPTQGRKVMQALSKTGEEREIAEKKLNSP